MSISRSEIFRKKKSGGGDRKFKFAMAMAMSIYRTLCVLVIFGKARSQGSEGLKISTNECKLSKKKGWGLFQAWCLFWLTTLVSASAAAPSCVQLHGQDPGGGEGRPMYNKQQHRLENHDTSRCLWMGAMIYPAPALKLKLLRPAISFQMVMKCLF